MARKAITALPMTMASPNSAYLSLPQACARIDRRHVGYRFDLEKDIPWDQIEAPGHYFGTQFFTSIGLNASAIATNPKAFADLQWALALSTCEDFIALEQMILTFAEEEPEQLGPTRSLHRLCEEEEKHILLFQRYAKWLRACRPDLTETFDRHFVASAQALGGVESLRRLPDAASRHYTFWLNTLFFEEYTIWLAEQLEVDQKTIQPVWFRAHDLHRAEEGQHILTDDAHLRALNMTPGQRDDWSTAFLTRLDQAFPRLIGIEAPLALLHEKYEDLASALSVPSLRRGPFLQELLFSPAFRQTRQSAPALRRLQQVTDPTHIASDVDSGRLKSPAPLAHLIGPAYQTRPLESSELSQALSQVAQDHPDSGVIHVGLDGSENLETYAALLGRAELWLGGLRNHGLRRGDHAVLLLSDTHDYVAAFWSCMLGGIIAVPLSLPVTRSGLEDHLARIRKIHQQLDHPLVIVDPLLRSFLDALPADDPLRAARTLTPDELTAGAGRTDHWTPADPRSPAFIQYSSGSTGTPHGILVSHQNVLCNLQACIELHNVAHYDVFVSWMPLYHDMGLAYHVIAVLVGAQQVLLSPLSFLKDPLIWLRKLHDHRGSISASPNFGLSRILGQAKPKQLENLDLRAVRCVLNGAEPISARVVKGFTELLAPAGLWPEAICPAYGLAEATVAVTMNAPGEKPAVHWYDRTNLDPAEPALPVTSDHPHAVSFVDVGRPVAGCEVRVVDHNGRLAHQGTIGRIQVKGLNVTSGYLGLPEETAAVFASTGWLTTGDLGLVIDGRLCVTGREKEVVFAHGRNLYAHDLEEAAIEVEGITPGRVAVVGTNDEGSGAERIVAFAHVKPASGIDGSEVLRRLQIHLSEVAGYPVHQVIPLPAEEFPKTSSGKLQRFKLRQRYERGDFGAKEVREPESAPAVEPPIRTQQAEVHEISAHHGGAQFEAVRQIWSQVLAIDPGHIGLDDPFAALGGDSIRAVEIHGHLETRFGVALDQRLLLDCRTVRQMASFVVAQLASDARQPLAASRPAATCTSRPSASSEAIAIIGMGCRLPGAASPEALWELLAQGRSAVGPVPDDRWDASAWHHPDPREPGRSVCQVGGFLDQVYHFDPEAFGISEQEAVEIEPQQRLFLEVAFEALERAGVTDRRIGVFAAAGGNQYLHGHIKDPSRISALTALGNLRHMVAARVAQVMKLQGPALTINAACASSLVAVHLACRSLRDGECDLALAGGVELNLTVLPYLMFSQAGVLSPRGQCQPFSSQADGFVPGEGAGAVLLSTLEHAQRLNAPVLAVIRGSAINNDGGALSGMAPNPTGQREVIAQAYQRAGVDTASVGYIEAHAAGTPVGDPIEVRSLSRVFGNDGAGRGWCGIGSIKSNIGHLFNAAGIASLIKVVLSLRHRQLAPSLGCQEPDLGIDFPSTPFFPVQQLMPWETQGEAPRRAGIDAFGIGGTNCHIIVEEASAPVMQPLSSERDAELFCLSAPTVADIPRVADAYSGWLDENAGVRLSDLARASHGRAPRFSSRSSFVARDTAEAADLLRRLAAETPSPTPASAPRLVFVFPGPGPQHPGMGRHLYDQAQVYRDAIAACDSILRPILGRSLEALIHQDDDTDDPEMDRIALTQPVMFAVDYALARWLISVGVRPDAVIGHSAGEYVAACIAGVFSLEQALELVTRRGAAMAEAPAGEMVAVFAAPELVEPLLRVADGQVTIATLNEPDQVVISGSAQGMEKVLACADERHISWKRLRISCAAHSPLMATAQRDFAPHLERLDPAPPALPFFSTVHAGLVDTLPHGYWTDQLRAPVRFTDTIAAAAAAGYRAFLEVGPAASLSPCIQATLLRHGIEDAMVLPTLRRTMPGWEPLLTSIGNLFESGIDVDLAALHNPTVDENSRALRTGIQGAPIILPGYPYRRRLLSHQDSEPAPRAAESAAVLGQRGKGETSLCLETEPAIRDHKVHGRAIAPAALLVDMAIAAMRSEQQEICGLCDVVIGRPLALSNDETRTARVSLRTLTGANRVLVASRQTGMDGASWEDHLSGLLPQAPPMPAPDLDLAAIRSRCQERVPIDEIYAHLSGNGLSYGPTMRSLVSVTRSHDEALARIEAPAPSMTGSVLHPAVVDGAMQAIGGLTMLASAEEDDGTFVGFAIGKITVQAPARSTALAHVRLRAPLLAGAETIHCDVTLCDDAGHVLATAEDVSLKRFADPTRPRFFSPTWQPLEIESSASLSGSSLILGRSTALCQEVAQAATKTGLTASAQGLPSDRDELRLVLEHQPADQALVLLDPSAGDLLSTAQALHDLGRATLPALVAVGSRWESLGLMRVLAREEPLWSCRCLLLEPAACAPSEIARHLRMAIEPQTSHQVLRILSGKPHELSLTPITPAPDQPSIPKASVWWITGGLGGIGLELARRLAVDFKARLLLTGRREQPDRKALDSIRVKGGEAVYVSADVTDEKAMANARDVALARWGSIHGVVHAAGVLDDGSLRHCKAEQLQATMAPKREGARTLAEVTRSLDLVHLVYFGSLAWLAGRPGQGSYAAANGAMAEIAHELAHAGRSVQCLDWGPWSALGMTADPSHDAMFMAEGITPMQADSGISAFYEALRCNASELVVLAIDPQRAELLASALDKAPRQLAGSRPTQVTEEPAARQQTASPERPASHEEFIRDFLGRRLRLAPGAIDSRTTFARLGVDSLMAVELVRALEANTGLRLHPTLLFELQTLEELLSHLRLKSPAQPLDPAPGVQPPKHQPDESKLPPQPAGHIPSPAKFPEPANGGHRAWLVGASAGELTRTTRPATRPGAGEVEISVSCAGVNFIDLLAVAGMHPVLGDAHFVPGHEVSGLVERVGPEVTDLSPGDRVVALARSGGYAERVICPAPSVVALPNAVAFDQAAAILVTGLTAISCLEHHARLEAGEKILIQAAAGATGTACAQLAIHLGAEVFGTAGSEAKLEALQSMGVTHPINYREQAFDDAVRDLTSGQGVDVIVDSLSGDAITRGLEILRPGGRFVEIGAAGVIEAPSVDPHSLFMAGQSFLAVNVARLEERPQLLARHLKRFVELVSERVLVPVIGHRLPFEEAAEAQRLLRDRINVGKVILEITS